MQETWTNSSFNIRRGKNNFKTELYKITELFLVWYHLKFCIQSINKQTNKLNQNESKKLIVCSLKC